MRWLTGSLNGTAWSAVSPTLVALVVCVPILLVCSSDLMVSQLGDDTASALGVRVQRLRFVVIVAAVALVAFATSAAGPIAFVAFLSGPIASRIVGPGASLLVPSALVGALLVMVSDFAGQWVLGTRFPVGVVTGVLGAPYLIYLVIRSNRQGGSL
jgi:iron complex transport system permease protein